MHWAKSVKNFQDQGHLNNLHNYVFSSNAR